MLPMLDLFSGIGGFSLGLERSGLARTVAFCEIEPFCRRILVKHWPSVPCYADIRDLTAKRLEEDGIERPRIICGGFPCQDISTAGKGAGIEGERSGLWREFARLIGEIRPDLAVVENVYAVRSRGLGRILSDLAAIGYDAEWRCIPASAVGAPHRRLRFWLVAYPQRDEQSRQEPRCWPDGRMGRVEQPFPWDRPWQSALSEFRGVDDGVPRSVASTDAYRNAVVPQVAELLGREVLRSLF